MHFQTPFLITILLFAAIVPSPAIDVFNEGVPGNSTRDLLKRLDGDVLALQPDVVVVLAGTNDRINSKKLVTLPDYLANQQTLVQRIQEGGATVILISPPPCITSLLLTRHEVKAYGDQPPEERLRSTATALKQFCHDEKIPFVDFHSWLTETGQVHLGTESVIRNPQNSGSKDGVHPTAEGYRLLASLVHKAIVTHQLHPERLVCFGDSITHGSSMHGAGTSEGDTFPAQLQRLLRSAKDGSH
tara:strand:- start:7033 stop:7764 length:732 start_codon:yes stop_codon:yes gene_type:complete